MPKRKEIVSELWLTRDKKLLEREMQEAAKELDFERATEIRNLINRLKMQNGKSKFAQKKKFLGVRCVGGGGGF